MRWKLRFLEIRRNPAVRCAKTYRFADILRNGDHSSVSPNGLKMPSLTTILRLSHALECRVYRLVDVFHVDPRGGLRWN